MIDSLRLQGFKNFREATVPVGPLTVIVGTNASGKSNLRDAFRFVHGMARGYSLADIVGEKYVEGNLLWRGIRGGSQEVVASGQSSFSLEIRLPWKSSQGLIPGKYHHRISVAVVPGKRPLRVVAESLYRDGKLVYDSHPPSDPPVQDEPEYLLVRLRQVKNQRHPGHTVRFRSDQPVISQFTSHPKVPGELRVLANRAIAQVQSMRFLDLSPDAMKVPSIPGQPLGDRGENLSSALQVICEDPSRKRAVTEWIRQLTPLDVVDLEFAADPTGKILLTLVESDRQKITAYSASDGTLRFLAIVAALMGGGPTQFYFLEEIDNGIHPTRLSLLLQLIEQHLRNGKLQIVTTTHSPQLLAMLSPQAQQNALLVYRMEDETEGHVQRIVEVPTAREVLGHQNLARLLESGWLENVVAFARDGSDDA